jgi:hypothetical protein
MFTYWHDKHVEFCSDYHRSPSPENAALFKTLLVILLCTVEKIQKDIESLYPEFDKVCRKYLAGNTMGQALVVRILARLIKLGMILVKACHDAMAWYDRVAIRGDQDLALVDEVFGVFIGVTLSFYLVLGRGEAWGGVQGIRMSWTLLTVVAVLLVSLIVAINMRRASHRLLGYFVAFTIAMLGVWWFVQVALHDVSPWSPEISALFVGSALWVFVRESSLIVLNLISRYHSVFTQIKESQDGRSKHNPG